MVDRLQLKAGSKTLFKIVTGKSLGAGRDGNLWKKMRRTRYSFNKRIFVSARRSKHIASEEIVHRKGLEERSASPMLAA